MQVHSAGGPQVFRGSASGDITSKGGCPVHPIGMHPWSHCDTNTDILDKQGRAPRKKRYDGLREKRTKTAISKNAQAIAAGPPVDDSTEANFLHLIRASTGPVASPRLLPTQESTEGS